MTAARAIPAGRKIGETRAKTVTLAHGGGGKAMKDLIDDVFISVFSDGDGAALEDSAVFELAVLAERGDRLAFTSDGFVVDPLYFRGGDIGKLAVCGTVNDLSMSGAVPLYLSCAAIIEEGLDVDLLRRVARSMAETARAAGVRIVTGDTKVVQRGACDKLFLTTSGIGVIPQGRMLAIDAATPGDAVIVNGELGQHGATILAARGDMILDTDISSDCCALNQLAEALLAAAPNTRLMRDATRGGIATVLNEIASASRVSIEISEAAIPLRTDVRGFCEILGLDPLYLANEGRFVAVIPSAEVDAALLTLRRQPGGEGAVVIGQVNSAPAGRVTMRTSFGSQRIVDMLVGEQLPRIC